jgi:hypothetical protein
VQRTISTLTNASGVVTFGARFGGFNNSPSVRVTASGVFLANVPARSTDIAADLGFTGLTDFSLFAQGYLPCAGCDPCSTCPQLDFDDSGGQLGLNDFAIFGREFLNNSPQQVYCW